MKKTTKNKILQNEIANANKKKKTTIKDNSKKQKEFYEKIATECFNKTNIVSGLQNVINKKSTLTSEQKQIANNIKQQVKNFNANAKQNNQKTTSFKNMLLQNAQIDNATKQQILIHNNINIVGVKSLQKEQTSELISLFEQINKTNKTSDKEQNGVCKIFIDKAIKEKLTILVKQIFNCEYNLSFNDIRQVYQNAYQLKQKAVK